MTCCGPATTAPLTEHHRLRVRYLGGRPIVVQGPATGTCYRFSGLQREQLVDPRDGVAILRSRQFRLEGLTTIPNPYP